MLSVSIKVGLSPSSMTRIGEVLEDRNNLKGGGSAHRHGQTDNPAGNYDMHVLRCICRGNTRDNIL